jgi:hypothetical protein
MYHSCLVSCWLCHHRHIARLQALITVIHLLARSIYVYCFDVDQQGNTTCNSSSTVVRVCGCQGLVLVIAQ